MNKSKRLLRLWLPQVRHSPKLCLRGRYCRTIQCCVNQLQEDFQLTNGNLRLGLVIHKQQFKIRTGRNKGCFSPTPEFRKLFFRGVLIGSRKTCCPQTLSTIIWIASIRDPKSLRSSSLNKSISSVPVISLKHLTPPFVLGVGPMPLIFSPS